MPNDQLQWLAITDFSHGIMQRLNQLAGDTVSFPVGAADATHTFRCIALPGGGLAPLPQQDATYARTGGLPDASVTIGKIFNGRFTISGAHLAARNGQAAGSFSSEELDIAYEWGANISGTQYQHRYRWERHRLYEATPTVDSIVNFATTDDSPLTTVSMGPTWFHNYRADASSQTTLGAPLVVGAWYASPGGLAQRFWKTFPDPATLGTTGTASISSSKNPGLVVGHQGRSLEFDVTTWAHGANGNWTSNEQVYYTKVNLASLASSSAAVFQQEDCQSFGAVASANASELMLVRFGSGGYVIRGDLDNPTVVYIPGIPGTGNLVHAAAMTPIGLVYGSRTGGVWAWAGGDTAEPISLNLEQDFWEPSLGDFTSFSGKFAFWKNWILLPNNWLYDWQNKSWWKIDDPSLVSIYHWLPSTDSHYICGAPRDIAASSDPSLYRWNADHAATSFSWESQVLPIGDSYHTAQPREIVVIAQGVGTVKWTISGYDAAGAVQSTNGTGTWASTARPEAMRFPVGAFHGLTHLRLRLESTATSTQTPIIYEAHIGYHSDAHLQVN